MLMSFKILCQKLKTPAAVKKHQLCFPPHVLCLPASVEVGISYEMVRVAYMQSVSPLCLEKAGVTSMEKVQLLYPPDRSQLQPFILEARGIILCAELCSVSGGM